MFGIGVLFNLSWKNIYCPTPLLELIRFNNQSHHTHGKLFNNIPNVEHQYKKCRASNLLCMSYKNIKKNTIELSYGKGQKVIDKFIS